MTIKGKCELVCRLLLMVIRHPVRSLRALSWRKIKRLFRYAASGDFGNLKMLISSGSEVRAIPPTLKVSAPDLVMFDKSRNRADLPVSEIKAGDKPQVSILIPQCSNFESTVCCIQALLKNGDDISFEILIQDDESTGVAEEICRLFPGVRRLSVGNPAGYFQSASILAEHAQGKYLLYLHTCAQIQKNCLGRMASLMEMDEQIGIVGPMLIYPDGSLKCAGGIALPNGDELYYGNKDNAASPEYQYLKECDYVPGAALMLRKSLWEKLDWISNQVSDAVDLAFAVRNMGYRVVYQPRSVTACLDTEISEGTTPSRKRQYKRIRPSYGADNLFRARDRSCDKKILLMIDQYVPHFDKDAGSRTVYQYLKMFVGMGLHVKFIGDDFCQHEPYTDILQQMGIEVLNGAKYARCWKKWIRDKASNIDYIFLNRPHIAYKYMSFLRKHTDARIFYYGHDLVFLREMREFEITGDISFRESALEWQSKELELMRKADMAYYPSYVEVDEVHSIDPEIQVKAIPAYLFEDVKWEGYDYESRKDIMFIGGFGHRPNIDAVKWLANDILPELVKYLPDIKIHILGSNAPKEVLALAGKNLIMEGFVTDDQLEQFYRSCRISLVPLRYGAGIKGKVVEAMRYGTPVVTTTTGAEGISNAEDVMLVEDDPAVLAKKIAVLYQDPERLTAMSQNSISYIQENYSPKNAISVIGPEFDLS